MKKFLILAMICFSTQSIWAWTTNFSFKGRKFEQIEWKEGESTFDASYHRNDDESILVDAPPLNVKKRFLHIFCDWPAKGDGVSIYLCFAGQKHLLLEAGNLGANIPWPDGYEPFMEAKLLLIPRGGSYPLKLNFRAKDSEQEEVMLDF